MGVKTEPTQEEKKSIEKRPGKHIGQSKDQVNWSDPNPERGNLAKKAPVSGRKK